MDFKEATEQLKQQNKVRRKAWESTIYLLMNEVHEVKCYRLEAVPFNYDVNIIMSNDWVIVGEEEGEQYCFPDVVQNLLFNKKIKLKEWPEQCYLEATPNGKEVFMRRICEYPFTPTFECFTSTDWEVI